MPPTHWRFAACGRGEMFGPRGKRQLPLPPMLMFDRISRDQRHRRRNTARGRSGRSSDVKPDSGFSAAISRNDPVMPGSWGSTRCGRWSASTSAGRRRGPRPGAGPGHLKFSAGSAHCPQVVYQTDIKRVMRGKLVLGVADGWFSGRRDYLFARRPEVGLFKQGAKPQPVIELIFGPLHKNLTDRARRS